MSTPPDRETQSESVPPEGSGDSLTTARVPTHVAIIMDGNGRWAAARGLPRAAGHRAGLEAVRRALAGCRERGVSILTLYAFSTENWRRPPEEVEALMQLLGQALQDDAFELVRAGIQLRVSGDLTSLDAGLRREVERVMAQTRPNRDLILNVAYNYGGRAEIVAAIRRIAQDVRAGGLSPHEIDDSVVGRHLYTVGLPDPDLLIRTGGEQRISNFLLWQIAYTELYFCDVYWPDFDTSHLFAAISAYQQRQRRFGGVEG